MSGNQTKITTFLKSDRPKTNFSPGVIDVVQNSVQPHITKYFKPLGRPMKTAPPKPFSIKDANATMTFKMKIRRNFFRNLEIFHKTPSECFRKFLAAKHFKDDEKYQNMLRFLLRTRLLSAIDFPAKK